MAWTLVGRATITGADLKVDVGQVDLPASGALEVRVKQISPLETSLFRAGLVYVVTPTGGRELGTRKFWGHLEGEDVVLGSAGQVDAAGTGRLVIEPRTANVKLLRSPASIGPWVLDVWVRPLALATGGGGTTPTPTPTPEPTPTPDPTPVQTRLWYGWSVASLGGTPANLEDLLRRGHPIDGKAATIAGSELLYYVPVKPPVQRTGALFTSNGTAPFRFSLSTTCFKSDGTAYVITSGNYNANEYVDLYWLNAVTANDYYQLISDSAYIRFEMLGTGSRSTGSLNDTLP